MIEVKQEVTMNERFDLEIKNIEEALFGKTHELAYKNEYEIPDVDDTDHSLLQEDEDILKVQQECAMDEPVGLEFEDVEDSLFIQTEELSQQDIEDALVDHTQELVYWNEYKIEDTHNIPQGYLLWDEGEGAMQTKSEHASEEPELIVDPKVGPDKYQVYITTIHMPHCLFFPSIGDEEVANYGSQDQVVVTSETVSKASQVVDTLHHELFYKKSLSPTSFMG